MRIGKIIDKGLRAFVEALGAGAGARIGDAIGYRVGRAIDPTWADAVREDVVVVEEVDEEPN